MQKYGFKLKKGDEVIINKVKFICGIIAGELVLESEEDTFIIEPYQFYEVVK